jgi:hypothetical protein
MFPELPISRFLIALNDYDVPEFEVHYELALGLHVAIALFLFTTSLYVLTFFPFLLQDIIITLFSSVSLNIIALIFSYVGQGAWYVAAGAALALIGAFLYREYIAYNERTNTEASKIAKAKRKAKRKKYAFKGRESLMAQLRAKKALTDAMANSRINDGDIGSVVKISSKFKPSALQFKPYDSTLSPSKMSRTGTVVPIYVEDEGHLPPGLDNQMSMLTNSRTIASEDVVTTLANMERMFETKMELLRQQIDRSSIKSRKRSARRVKAISTGGKQVLSEDEHPEVTGNEEELAENRKKSSRRRQRHGDSEKYSRSDKVGPGLANMDDEESNNDELLEGSVDFLKGFESVSMDPEGDRERKKLGIVPIEERDNSPSGSIKKLHSVATKGSSKAAPQFPNWH